MTPTHLVMIYGRQNAQAYFEVFYLLDLSQKGCELSPSLKLHAYELSPLSGAQYLFCASPTAIIVVYQAHTDQGRILGFLEIRVENGVAMQVLKLSEHRLQFAEPGYPSLTLTLSKELDTNARGLLLTGIHFKKLRPIHFSLLDEEDNRQVKVEIGEQVVELDQKNSQVHGWCGYRGRLCYREAIEQRIVISDFV